MPDPQTEIGIKETPVERCQRIFERLDEALIARNKSPDDLQLVKNCELIIDRLAEATVGMSPADMRAVIWPILTKEGLFWETLEAQVTEKPYCRPPDVQFSGAEGFEYWGNRVRVANLPTGNDKWTAVEISGGVLGILDDKGKAVGVLDISPRVRRESREIDAELLPPERLFETSLASSVQAKPKEIADFLENYSTFFSQTGDFARATGFSDRFNLNIVPMEAKFLIFRQLQGNLASKDSPSIMRFFYDNGALGGEMLRVVGDRPDLMMSLVRLANKFSGQYPEPYFYRSELGSYAGAEALVGWLTTQPRYSSEELIEKIRVFGRESTGDPLRWTPEFLGWIAEVESFSIEMGIKMLGKREITVQELEFAQELGGAIKGRNRAMTFGFLEYMRTETSYLDDGRLTEENRRAIDFFRDGIRAQKALVAYMSVEGTKGLAEAINLPPFFFQEYRKVHAGNPEAREVMGSIMDLWEQVYLQKEKAKGATPSTEAIRAFWTRNEQQVSSGEETGETKTEISRDSAVIRELKERYTLPHHVKVIDFGPWNGRRRLQPLLDILTKEGFETIRVVGIDINQAPDPIPEMELKQMTFAQAGKEKDLRGDFDIAKCDWSASNDPYRLKEQILDFIAFSKTLRKGGVLILDTCVPEGSGSYEEFVIACKNANPDIPEGVFEFKYASSEGESKPFMLYYYEVLNHFCEQSGLEIINLPAGFDDRNEFFGKVIKGEADIANDNENPFIKPVWQAKGRPRITIVAQKISEVEESSSPFVRLMVKKELQEAA